MLRKLKGFLSPSYVVVFMSGALLFYSFGSAKRWEKERLLKSDEVYYWLYAPATWLYQDLQFNFPDDAKRDGHVWYLTTEDGKHYSKMWCGASLMYTPFFLVGHVASKFYPEYHSNGYSLPYTISVSLGAIVYVLMALLLLRGILKRFFSEWVTALTLALLVWATNLFYYAAYENLMTHAYSFFLFALFAWILLKWQNNPKLTAWMGMGAVLGLIVLVRPPNALIAIIPVWLFLQRAFQEGWARTFKKHGVAILISTFLLVLVVSIQFLYWKLGTGHWFMTSYNDEHFFFNDPKILDGLFSYTKGWLVYTPVMAFALVGIFLMRSKLNSLKWPFVAYLVVQFYVIFSWWCWWYGGSFGMRPMIETYALLALPLAVFINWVWHRSKIMTVAFLAVCTFFVYLNVFQTWQYRKSYLHWSDMTKESYWTLFLKDHTPEGYWEQLKHRDNDLAKQGIGR